MNWLNIHTSTIRSSEFIGSEPAERATWLCVLGHCAEQENGGRIVGAATWKDRQWQQICGVTLKEVKATTHLFKWEGDDLICLFYPLDKEAQVQANRETGRTGGIKSGEARRKHSLKQEPSTASSAPSSSASTEGKGREGNRMEGEGKEPPAPEFGTWEGWMPEEQAVAQCGNVGVPQAFVRMVYRDWDSREGKDGAGVKTHFAKYVTRRWSKEAFQWKSGNHKGRVGAEAAKPKTDIRQGIKEADFRAWCAEQYGEEKGAVTLKEAPDCVVESFIKAKAKESMGGK